ncbi:ABC transporter ATP-binding protein [Pseudoalteromonas ruthenica]|uniref:ABC transporter n=1 Tax=Pseudoalteromonas ruthenica TaxID=151081 RepID=A0A0F4PHQ7_9GAMM|nr:ABC transporter ATP-binding protein [Pseudoalteromonas ruthenica]KJY94674.1 ABC transporter [Pseudoalteromonas ruthenica]KJY98610.1 ABC transporter [Pseudoalteromonas ruthenica]TMO89988.1 ABC transporter ATP-binding protein [Pseudoalteromonas ruthenica]TMO91337.1 ABC transporter ATP-binding protein [Pseudoalteromonas ruthenica]TMP01684.1 ABC transporter ATP-binding protein [Pseudoalteromonas ruthenica]
MTAQLELDNISFEYAERAVVNNLSLTLADDEILCLLGASGCGKTTTLKAIAGLIRPHRGVIRLGKEVLCSDQHCVPPQHRNMGMMFQDYALFPHLTVAQNIAFGLKGMSKANKQQRVAEMLALVHLDECGGRYPHQLSGGQQQRVAIARALAYKPSLLLLDEPFSNIDHQVRFQLIADIRRIIKDQRVSAIFVTHSKEEAFAFADTLAVMHNGQIAQQGTAKQLFQHPNSKVVAEFLGTGVYIDATIVDADHVQTPFGIVRSLQPLPSSGKGQVYVRPHDMQLIGDEHGEVTLLSQRFVGTEYVYRVSVFAQEVEIPAKAEQEFLPSQKLSLTITPHSVNFFAD